MIFKIFFLPLFNQQRLQPGLNAYVFEGDLAKIVNHYNK